MLHHLHHLVDIRVGTHADLIVAAWPPSVLHAPPGSGRTGGHVGDAGDSAIRPRCLRWRDPVSDLPRGLQSRQLHQEDGLRPPLPRAVLGALAPGEQDLPNLPGGLGGWPRGRAIDHNAAAGNHRRRCSAGGDHDRGGFRWRGAGAPRRKPCGRGGRGDQLPFRVAHCGNNGGGRQLRPRQRRRRAEIRSLVRSQTGECGVLSSAQRRIWGPRAGSRS
mmetsp:Transcript_112638/g.251422  ORF Transcript_112638/g.251422 Transcript_112638/m.251422 type:complete len:218 (+) Transcript_112638:698-1351(+)